MKRWLYIILMVSGKATEVINNKGAVFFSEEKSEKSRIIKISSANKNKVFQEFINTIIISYSQKGQNSRTEKKLEELLTEIKKNLYACEVHELTISGVFPDGDRKSKKYTVTLTSKKHLEKVLNYLYANEIKVINKKNSSSSVLGGFFLLFSFILIFSFMLSHLIGELTSPVNINKKKLNTNGEVEEDILPLHIINSDLTKDNALNKFNKNLQLYDYMMVFSEENRRLIMDFISKSLMGEGSNYIHKPQVLHIIGPGGIGKTETQISIIDHMKFLLLNNPFMTPYRKIQIIKKAATDFETQTYVGSGTKAFKEFCLQLTEQATINKSQGIKTVVEWSEAQALVSKRDETNVEQSNHHNANGSTVAALFTFLEELESKGLPVAFIMTSNVKKEDVDESLKRRVTTIEATVVPTIKNIYKVLNNILYYNFGQQNSTLPLWNLLGEIIHKNLDKIVKEIHRSYVENFKKLCDRKLKCQNFFNPNEKQVKLIDKIKECTLKFKELDKTKDFFNNHEIFPIYELTSLLHYDFYLRIDKILQAIENIISHTYEMCKKETGIVEDLDILKARTSITQEEFDKKFSSLTFNEEKGKEFFQEVNGKSVFKFEKMKEVILKALIKALAKTADI